MLIAIIVSVAVLAFLIVLCVIYFDNIKQFFAKKKKSKKKQQAQPQPKQEIKPEDFIPLKNQYDDQTRDSSLDALFAEEDENSLQEDLSFEDEIPSQPATQNAQRRLSEQDFGDLFGKDFSSQKKSSKATIAEQIKNLSPELKALLLDSTLKKRDDV